MHSLKIAAFALLACTACKGRHLPLGGSGASEAHPAEPAKPLACAAGFTNPENIGICIKVPAELKPIRGGVGHGGDEQSVGWSGDGSVVVGVVVGKYSAVFWDTNNKNLLAGGGFGGRLLEQGKLGADGMWATFTADTSTMERKLLVSRIHNKQIEVQCTAERSVLSNIGVKMDDVLDICKTITVGP